MRLQHRWAMTLALPQSGLLSETRGERRPAPHRAAAWPLQRKAPAEQQTGAKLGFCVMCGCGSHPRRLFRPNARWMSIGASRAPTLLGVYRCWHTYLPRSAKGQGLGSVRAAVASRPSFHQIVSAIASKDCWLGIPRCTDANLLRHSLARSAEHPRLDLAQPPCKPRRCAASAY